MLKIGISASFMHADQPRAIFQGMTLQYIEQNVAHWLMQRDVLAFMGGIDVRKMALADPGPIEEEIRTKIGAAKSIQIPRLENKLNAMKAQSAIIRTVAMEEKSGLNLADRNITKTPQSRSASRFSHRGIL